MLPYFCERGDYCWLTNMTPTGNIDIILRCNFWIIRNTSHMKIHGFSLSLSLNTSRRIRGKSTHALTLPKTNKTVSGDNGILRRLQPFPVTVLCIEHFGWTKQKQPSSVIICIRDEVPKTQQQTLSRNTKTFVQFGVLQLERVGRIKARVSKSREERDPHYENWAGTLHRDATRQDWTFFRFRFFCSVLFLYSMTAPYKNGVSGLAEC